MEIIAFLSFENNICIKPRYIARAGMPGFNNFLIEGIGDTKEEAISCLKEKIMLNLTELDGEFVKIEL
jgi:hypothetical protein